MRHVGGNVDVVAGRAVEMLLELPPVEHLRGAVDHVHGGLDLVVEMRLRACTVGKREHGHRDALRADRLPGESAEVRQSLLSLVLVARVHDPARHSSHSMSPSPWLKLPASRSVSGVETGCLWKWSSAAA